MFLICGFFVTWSKFLQFSIWLVFLYFWFDEILVIIFFLWLFFRFQLNWFIFCDILSLISFIVLIFWRWELFLVRNYLSWDWWFRFISILGGDKLVTLLLLVIKVCLIIFGKDICWTLLLIGREFFWLFLYLLIIPNKR